MCVDRNRIPTMNILIFFDSDKYLLITTNYEYKIVMIEISFGFGHIRKILESDYGKQDRKIDIIRLVIILMNNWRELYL